ncbi:MAG: hypothetical protein AAFN77_22215 [Planctomycetota bacterium]
MIRSRRVNQSYWTYDSFALLRYLMPLVLFLTAWFCLQGMGNQNAIGQDQVALQDWKQGFHGLNILAQGNEFQVCTLEQWQQTPMSERCVIALGWIDKLPVDLTDCTRRGVPVLVASDRENNIALAPYGILIRDSFQQTADSRFYFGYFDCPRVPPITNNRSNLAHPIFSQVDYVIANRPGTLIANPAASSIPIEPIAFYQGSPRNGAFALATPRNSKDQFVCLGDDTLFNNQMLTLDYNTRFATNSLQWLSQNGQRKRLLIIVDNQVMPRSDPSALAILPPPPSTEEVVDAIKNLPVKAWPNFAGDLINTAHAQNLPNEFINQLQNKMSNRSALRAVLLALFVAVAMFIIVTYVWQKKLLRKSASTVAERRQKIFSDRSKLNQLKERQVAANLLLNSFCIDICNRRLEDWGMFPQGLELGSDQEANEIINQMSDYNQALRTQPPKFWTEAKLRGLERDVTRWRSFVVSRNFGDETERAATSAV